MQLDPTAPTPRATIAAGSDQAVTDALTALPATTMAQEVRELVAAALPGRATAQSPLPTVDVVLCGADVAVSVSATAARQCLLGVRTAGRVIVRQPSRTQLQPAELSCDPQTAFALLAP